jgi:hypothetical protein
MSDNDLISRSHFDDRVRLAAGADADEEFSADFLDGVKTVLYILSTEPAVPHEMSAVEYLETEARMCKFYGLPCAFDVSGLTVDEAIEMVEKFAREHPEEANDGE